MIRLTTTLWRWQGEGASWHFLTVPEALADEIRAQSLAHRGGFGSVRVEARVNGITWRTSVFPQKSGGYILPVKAGVRREAGIAAGDEASLELLIL